MAVLALTGNLASGKSSVLKLLKNKGAITFDADRRVHQYYQKKQSIVYKKVAASFPGAIKAGIISQKKLADIVFSDKSKLKILEEIIHPLIKKDLFKWIDKAKDKKRIYVAEVPLLFEKKLEGYFDKVILVKAKPAVFIQRIIKKYNLSPTKVADRLSLYIPVRAKIKRADFIIDNSFSFKKLEKEVGLLLKKIN